MLSNLGLRAHMTLSYLAVSVVAVVVVEVLAVGIVLPRLFGEQELLNRVQVAALRLANEVSVANLAADRGGLELPADYQPGDPSAPSKTSSVTLTERSVAIPILKQADLPANSPFAMVVDVNRRVVASSWAPHVVAGTDAGLYVTKLALDMVDGRAGVVGGNEPVVWAADMLFPGKVRPPGFKPLPLGWVYVQVPDVLPAGFEEALTGSALGSGLVLLLISVPLAVLFGILTTRATIRRLARLGSAGGRIGEGELEPRVDEGPPDEIGRLERSFNVMAARLESARGAQRRAIEDETRAAERSRIARELHDAISQDLFSLSMIAGGLEKALPTGELRERARALRETAEEATQEMSELLLELRPSALDEGGLTPALVQLCSAYRSRLGIEVTEHLEQLKLEPGAEHALLRLTQEAMSNAVRHGGARKIDLDLSTVEGHAILSIRDDGAGFDAAVNGHGLGLRLMRDRVEELGGSFAITSKPGSGTEVSARLPLSS